MYGVWSCSGGVSVTGKSRTACCNISMTCAVCFRTHPIGIQRAPFTWKRDFTGLPASAFGVLEDFHVIACLVCLPLNGTQFFDE
jgi:hypothetical protein